MITKKNLLINTLVFVFIPSLLISVMGFTLNSTIIGKITDEKGIPIKDVEIYLYSETLYSDSSDTKLFNKYWAVNGGWSNTEGNYIIKPIPSGKFYIVALRYGYYISELEEITITSNKRFQHDFKLIKIADSSEVNKIPYDTYRRNAIEMKSKR